MHSSPVFEALPPREPSPVPFVALSPLPSPALRSQRSRQRLRLPSRMDSPPIPPTLIGSPLLDSIKPRTRAVSMNPDVCGDDFGARKEHIERRKARTQHRRNSSISISPNSATRVNARARSPPPTPRRPSIAPPVPPIPDYIVAEANRDRALLRPCSVSDEIVPAISISAPAPAPNAASPVKPRGLSGSQAGSRTAFTCINYLAHHNSRGPMSVRAH